MPIINVRNVDHYYEWIREPGSNGQKPVIIFIHGWGGSSRYWESTAKALSDRYDGLLYDLRGFGRSEFSPFESLTYELEEYSRDLAALLDALNLNVVYLNAHSMGASVAVFFLNMYPERVEKAILNCSGIFEYDEKSFAAFYKFGKYVVKLRYKWFLKVPYAHKLFMARFLARQIASKESKAFLEDFVLANYEAALGTIYTSVSKRAVEVLPQEFARISTPTLLIAGEKDRIIPPAMGRKAAALNPNTIKYEEIAQTGHFPMLEDPKTYLAKVREFLESDC